MEQYCVFCWLSVANWLTTVIASFGVWHCLKVIKRAELFLTSKTAYKLHGVTYQKTTIFIAMITPKVASVQQEVHPF